MNFGAPRGGDPAEALRSFVRRRDSARRCPRQPGLGRGVPVTVVTYRVTRPTHLAPVAQGGAGSHPYGRNKDG
jgi:hypothetical protein